MNSPSGSNKPDVRKGRVQRVYPERGFGFIRIDGPDHQDVFFHTSGLKDTVIFELQEGEEVTFELRDTPKGKRAEEIWRVV
ncbi:MAG TPA: cold shock domain-containing protein [Chloroflexota bacterium]|nr:cold shock domain-containing protein [Chloroflexota bacterium]